MKSSAFFGANLTAMADREYIWGETNASGERNLIEMRLRRSTGIGTGKVVTAAKLSKMWDGEKQGPTTGQFYGPQPKVSNATVLTKTGKEKALSAKQRQKDEKQVKKRKAQSELDAIEDRRKKRGSGTVHWCTFPGCTRRYHSEAFFNAHMERGDHTGGVRHLRKGKPIRKCTGTSMHDMMRMIITEKGGFADTFSTTNLMLGAAELVLKHQPQARLLLTGSALAYQTSTGVVGFARKPKRGKGGFHGTVCHTYDSWG